MRKIHECLVARSKITELTTLQNNLVAFSTLDNGVKIFSLSGCEIKVNLVSEHLNSKTTAICFSPDAQILAFANQTIIYIIHISTHKLLKSIDTNGEIIEILSFDPSSNYIIAGSKNGRVLQYKYNEALLLSRLCSFPYNESKNYQKIKKNFVSTFTFCENQIACSGYGGTIFVIDLLSQANKDVIRHGRVRIDALCFLNNETLISGNIDGAIDIISLKDSHAYKRINAPFRQILQILVMPNPDYIMVTSKKHIAIFDIKNYKLIDKDYVQLGGDIDKVSLLGNESLVVAFNEVDIATIELPSIEKLKLLILHNSLDKAFDLIFSEPMIRDSYEHKELEKKYRKIYLKAVDALIHHNKILALQLTDMFKHTFSKKDEIKSLFLAFDNYPKFQLHFSEKKLTLAYAMVDKYPALKYTWQYARMEQLWKGAFKSAQKQILLGREDNAKLYLNEYMPIVSKRGSIQLILKQNKEFIEFLQAIEKRDYKIVNRLALKNEIFTQIPTYAILNQEIENYIKKIEKYIKKGEIKPIKEYLIKLENIPYLKDKVIKLNNDCKTVSTLQKAYKNNNFKACYELIDIHKHLAYTDLGVLLQKHWSKIIHNCEEYALKGDIKEVKHRLGELIALNSRRNKIGDLLRLSFHTKIKTLISRNKTKQAENIIYSYIDIFGLDSEINIIMKLFESKFSTQLAITYDKENRPTRDSWIRSEIIMGKMSNRA
ncbi:MAG: WD40 repeat domain-containing protein [Sulfurimonas sp.]|nr:WD40 repeat domain-containing protein [Sulfurimonas sp.]